ncbi:hypothetical protein ACWEPA_17430 [Streptomyces filamentosus]
MNALADASLEPAQRKLLVHIAEAWLQTGEWPQWGYVQHAFDRFDLDAERLLRSLPRVGADTVFAAGYGYTTAIPQHLRENDPVRLTVASSLVVEQMKEIVGLHFARVLQTMVKLYLDTEPTLPGEPPRPMLKADRLRSLVNRGKPGHQRVYPHRFIQALPELLAYEPAIAVGSRSLPPDGAWQLEITRSVLLFRNVRRIEDYVYKTCETVTATAARYAGDTGRLLAPTSDSRFGSFDETGLWDPTSVPPTASPADARPPYLDDDLLTQIETTAPSTRWKVDKLLTLCAELNDSYASNNAYTCAALIRAVLDHIPPVFGHRDFKQVAAQHTFTVQRTDKAHAQKLAGFKDIADDALHRPISANIPLITMNDIPEPARLRAVLHELVTIMRKAPAATT